MRMPQSLRNLQNRAKKFINKIGEAICCLCGVAAILAIMIPSGYLVSLLSVPTISIIIVAFTTPFYFGYNEIFEAGYNFPGAVIDFLATSFKGLVNSFKTNVLGMEVKEEEPEYVSRNKNINQPQNSSFLTYVKSWCPAFICGRNNNQMQRKPSFGNSLEEEQSDDEQPPEDKRLSRGGYSLT